jgi:hypothetical protein
MTTTGEATKAAGSLTEITIGWGEDARCTVCLCDLPATAPAWQDADSVLCCDCAAAETHDDAQWIACAVRMAATEIITASRNQHQGEAMTTFYVRVPEDQRLEWRLKHADETVQVAGGIFVGGPNDIQPQPDGTYEVRALASSLTGTVRQMLTEHEGLIILREVE